MTGLRRPFEIARWRRFLVMAVGGPPSTPSSDTTQESVDRRPAPTMTSDHDERVGFKGGCYNSVNLALLASSNTGNGGGPEFAVIAC